MKIEFQDAIDRYVLNEMSAKERADFEKQVAQDAELQEQLKFTQQMNTAIKSRNAKLEKMKEWEDGDIRLRVCCSERPRERTVMSPSSKKPFLWISSIAGIAAILAFGYFLFTPTSSSPGDVYMAPQMSVDSYRGSNSLQQIAGHINQREYEKALAEIEKEEKSLKAKEEEWSETFSSGTMSEEETEAMNYEWEVLKDIRYDLNWMKANALLGLGREEEAMALLEKLKAEAGEHRMQADSLYNVFKKWNR